ncbi:MAG: M48 family metallopeptidase [Candidatus Altiarchaeota archaeon]|nr:M48 family metallopeptidase [Candidatus Altiarchaeota archaeon]
MYDVGVMFLFLILSTVFNIAYVLYTYYQSDQIALSSVAAYPAEGPRFKQLNNVVEEMTIAGGLPKPRVYVMPSPDINAFATGRDPEHSVVCVTEGALQKLDRSELQGIIAHEMTHIRNYDIRFVTLVAVMVGLISIMSQLFLRSLWYGGLGGRDREGRGGGLLIVLLLAGIVLSIIAPLIVKLVQFAISRKREYMADAGSVELTRYPDGLASALEKIKDEYKKGPSTQVNAAIAPLFIADPVKDRFMSIFNTHPPIEERIRILRSM